VTRHHHPRPPAGAAAGGRRQLLSHARTRSSRDARRLAKARSSSPITTRSSAGRRPTLPKSVVPSCKVARGAVTIELRRHDDRPRLQGLETQQHRRHQDEAHLLLRRISAEPEEANSRARKDEQRKHEAALSVVSGIEALKRHHGVRRSMTCPRRRFPQRLGYAEGTLYPWIASDFSLMGRHRMRHRKI